MTVNFIFDIDDMVLTCLGEKGMITNCIIDNTRIKQYWVKTIQSEKCYREDQLIFMEDENETA